MRANSKANRLARPCVLLAAALALTACAHSAAPLVRTEIVRPTIPATLAAECAGPSNIPPGALSEAAAVRLWDRDRAALKDCGRRHRAVVELSRGR